MRRDVAFALRRRNAATFFVKSTPIDIWFAVATHLGVQDRVALSRVHFSLRERLAAVPDVWGQIDISCGRHSDVCQCRDCDGGLSGTSNLAAAVFALRHSRGAALHLSIRSVLPHEDARPNTRDFVLLQKELEPHAHRLRSLELRAGQYLCLEFVHNFLPRVHLPLLEYFDATVVAPLYLCDDCAAADEVGWDRQQRLCLPQVARLSMPAMCSFGLLRWDGQSTLLLRHLTCDMTSAADLLACLLTCPRLLHLQLDVQGFHFGASSPLEVAVAINATPLRSIRICGLRRESRFVETVRGLNVANVTLDCAFSSAYGLFYPFGDAPELLRVHVDPSPSVTASTRRPERTRSVRTCFGTVEQLSNFVSALGAPALAKVSALEVHEDGLRVLGNEGMHFPALLAVSVHLGRHRAGHGKRPSEPLRTCNVPLLRRIYVVGSGRSITDSFLRNISSALGRKAMDVEWRTADLYYTTVEPEHPDRPVHCAGAPPFPLDCAGA